MSQRFHEIAEARHRILNPLSEEKLELLGEIAEVGPGTRHVDLCCGKAEMLARFAARHDAGGVGVDLSATFVGAGRRRAEELGVAAKVKLVQGEAAAFARACPERFDVASCIGATWIGGGLAGTLALLRPLTRDASSRLLVGEVFWREDPPEEAWTAVGTSRDAFSSLEGTMDRCEAAGLEVVEMVVASPDDFDRYEASQWSAGTEWLRGNPADPDAAAFRSWLDGNRRAYVRHHRRCLGWGVFVLRPRAG